VDNLLPSSEKEILLEAVIRAISYKLSAFFCPETGGGKFPPKFW
jgi:hypothetical protein